MQTLTLSASRITALFKCPRNYAHNYESKLVPTGYSPAMTRGNFVHAGLEMFYKGDVVNLDKAWESATESLAGLPLTSSDMEQLDKINSLGCAMLEAYIQLHEDELKHITVLDVEKSYEFPYIKEYKPLNCAVNLLGKIDLVYHDNRTDDVIVMDHKTFSRVTDGMVDKLSMDLQLNLYVWLLNQAGIKPVMAAYNILAVSQIRHKKGQTKEAYIHELKTRYAKGEYFNRLNVFIDQKHTDEFEDELSKVVDHFLRTKSSGVFPRNTFACDLYGKCSYLPLCKEGQSAVDRGLYTAKKERK